MFDEGIYLQDGNQEIYLISIFKLLNNENREKGLDELLKLLVVQRVEEIKKEKNKNL